MGVGLFALCVQMTRFGTTNEDTSARVKDINKQKKIGPCATGGE